MDYHAMILTGHDLPENVNALGLISTGFEDLGLPPILGRGLFAFGRHRWAGPASRDGALVQVLANRTLAERDFPNGDAIGHSLKLPDIEDRPPAILSASNTADSCLQIVGIVGDARNDGATKSHQAGSVRTLHAEHVAGGPRFW
jgi:hypothetical protein